MEFYTVIEEMMDENINIFRTVMKNRMDENMRNNIFYTVIEEIKKIGKGSWITEFNRWKKWDINNDKSDLSKLPMIALGLNIGDNGYFGLKTFLTKGKDGKCSGEIQENLFNNASQAFKNSLDSKDFMKNLNRFLNLVLSSKNINKSDINKLTTSFIKKKRGEYTKYDAELLKVALYPMFAQIIITKMMKNVIDNLNGKRKNFTEENLDNLIEICQNLINKTNEIIDLNIKKIRKLDDNLTEEQENLLSGFRKSTLGVTIDQINKNNNKKLQVPEIMATKIFSLLFNNSKLTANDMKDIKFQGAPMVLKLLNSGINNFNNNFYSKLTVDNNDFMFSLIGDLYNVEISKNGDKFQLKGGQSKEIIEISTEDSILKIQNNEHIFATNGNSNRCSPSIFGAILKFAKETTNDNDKKIATEIIFSLIKELDKNNEVLLIPFAFYVDFEKKITVLNSLKGFIVDNEKMLKSKYGEERLGAINNIIKSIESKIKNILGGAEKTGEKEDVNEEDSIPYEKRRANDNESDGVDSNVESLSSDSLSSDSESLSSDSLSSDSDSESLSSDSNSIVYQESIIASPKMAELVFIEAPIEASIEAKVPLLVKEKAEVMEKSKIKPLKLNAYVIEDEKRERKKITLTHFQNLDRSGPRSEVSRISLNNTTGTNRNVHNLVNLFETYSK